MARYSPVPGIRPAREEALPSHPLITLSYPKANANGILDYGFSMQGSQAIRNDPVAWRAALIHDKSLFVKALIRIAKRDNLAFEPEPHFANLANGFSGSATILCVRPRNVDSRFEKFTPSGVVRAVSSKESTTRFQSSYGFIADTTFLDNAALPLTGVSSPLYSLDAEAIDIIQSHAKGKAILPALAQDFWKLLAMSEHDYVHAMTLHKAS